MKIAKPIGLFRVAAILVFTLHSFSLFSIDEMSELYTRLYTEYYNSTTGNGSYLTAQQSDGRWSDINYSDRSITNWDPIKHLQRVRAMAKTYCEQSDKNSSYALSLLSGIEKGLSAWYSGGYRSDNWFFNDIGQQREIGPILALMKNYVQSATLTNGANYLVINGSPTLTNLVWEAAGVLIKGSVLNNVTYIQQGVTNISNTLRPVNKGVEGIQDDYSYLFHGLQLYNGGYGYWMINDIAMWMNIMKGLSFGFSSQNIEMIRSFILQGDQWMIRRGQYDFGATGRNITRQNGISSSGVKTALADMQLVDPAFSTQYQGLVNHINGTNNSNLSGNKMFYRGDYMVQKRGAYHLSVKMCSSRTNGTEYMNGENAKGFWLPFGATCLMKDGGEYNTVFPLWDWTRVPGTTATAETPSFGSTLNQSSTFVGGVSNGQCGVATIDLNKQNLTGKKSWFMFDNETLCLGAAINSTSAYNVNTTIAQSQLRGTVRIDNVSKGNGTDVACPAVKWAFHDNTCYFFPTPTDLLLTNSSKSSTWSTINTSQSTTTFTDNLFSLVIPHNLRPTNGSYAYIIYPDVTPAKVLSYAVNMEVKVLSNSASIQAATQTVQKLTGAVFHSAAELVVDPFLTISVDQPCALMIDQSAEPISISMADPSQTKATINVTLRFSNYPAEIVNFQLPTGNKGGATLTKSSTTFRKEFFQGVTITKKPYLPLTVNETFTAEKVANCSACTTVTTNWSSSNQSVATVDNNGLITAKGNGEALIVATLVETGHKDSCRVQVMNKTVSERFETMNQITVMPGANWSVSGNTMYLSTPLGATVPSPEKNMALYNQNIQGEFVAACDMLVEETSSVWNDFCLIWGHQYPMNSYYYAHLCEGNDDAGSGVFRIENRSKSNQLTDISAPLTAGVWHEIALKITNNSAQVYLDGSLTSTTLLTSISSGKIGFGSYNDACRFSNFRVWQIDNSSAISETFIKHLIVRQTSSSLIVDLPNWEEDATLDIVDLFGRTIVSMPITATTTVVPLTSDYRGVLLLVVNSRNSQWKEKVFVGRQK